LPKAYGKGKVTLCSGLHLAYPCEIGGGFPRAAYIKKQGQPTSPADESRSQKKSWFHQVQFAPEGYC